MHRTPNRPAHEVKKKMAPVAPVTAPTKRTDVTVFKSKSEIHAEVMSEVEIKEKIKGLAERVGRADSDGIEGRVAAMLEDVDATLYVGALEWAILNAEERLEAQGSKDEGEGGGGGEEGQHGEEEGLCGLSDED